MKRTLFIGLLLSFLICTMACGDSDDSNDNPISGEWRITSIKVSQETLAQRSPEEELILVTFNSGGSFTGSTSSNQFSGRYEVDGNTITMLEFTTTEAGDTQYGLAFYEAITAAQVPNQTFAQFGYSLNGTDLILVFGNSGEMILEKQ